MSEHLSQSGASYPILVERLTGEQALVIVCQSCHAEATIGAEDIRNEMDYGCPKRCGGWAVYKYDEADRCPNCGKLDYAARRVEGCCSRVCKLQHDYAKELEASRA